MLEKVKESEEQKLNSENEIRGFRGRDSSAFALRASAFAEATADRSAGSHQVSEPSRRSSPELLASGGGWACRAEARCERRSPPSPRLRRAALARVVSEGWLGGRDSNPDNVVQRAGDGLLSVPVRAVSGRSSRSRCRRLRSASLCSCVACLIVSQPARPSRCVWLRQPTAPSDRTFRPAAWFPGRPSPASPEIPAQVPTADIRPPLPPMRHPIRCDTV